MKNKIPYFIVMLLGVMAVTFFACEEKEDYDFNAIEPAILAISGPAIATAHGNTTFPTRYTVPHRGGSTYDWQIGAPGGTVVLDPVSPSIAHITFNQSSVNTTATITVTETTMGGKVSAPFSRTITLNAFCPYNMTTWAGNYSGTRPTRHGPSVVLLPEPGLNLMRVRNLAWFVPNSWGENWVTGDGSCVMEFSCGNVVTILPQAIGNTDYPDRYGIRGSGTVDPATMTITLTYEVFYGWTGNPATSVSAVGPISTVLTKAP